MLDRVSILGVHVDVIDYWRAGQLILSWLEPPSGRFVCVANVHMVMEADAVGDFRALVNSADLVVPDGTPLVWMMRAKGRRGQRRVYGPDLLLHLAVKAERDQIPVGFYGGTPATLEQLQPRLLAAFPGLRIAYCYSPPFRALSPAEDEAVCAAVQHSGVRILFVGLGCPKQERWMAGHRDRIPAVMVGVGAAFDFLAGTKPQAPRWMHGAGLEWLFRLVHEPKRLWRRYLYHNPRFVFLALLELAGLRR